MNLFRKLFGASKAAIDKDIGAVRKPGDSERWQIGDEAECIHDGDWYCRNGFRLTKGAPALGDIFTVQATVIGMPLLFLKFRSSPYIFDNRGFRKLPPRDDAAIADLAAKIKAGASAPLTVEAFAARHRILDPLPLDGNAA
jgi:hypothetical protein